MFQQQTMLWNEKILYIAPAQKKKPVSILLDPNAEELSFPDIYLGYLRIFQPTLNVSWFSMATSEIRRQDRRGASPEHIFYITYKQLRLRVSNELHACFKVSGITSKNFDLLLNENRMFLEFMKEHSFELQNELISTTIGKSLLDVFISQNCKISVQHYTFHTSLIINCCLLGSTYDYLRQNIKLH